MDDLAVVSRAAREGDGPLSIERIPFDSGDFVDSCRRAVWEIETPFLETHWPGHVRYPVSRSSGRRRRSGGGDGGLDRANAR